MDDTKLAEQKFKESLRANNQLADVKSIEEAKNLPAHITHVCLPDGSIQRIRFNLI